MVDFPYLCRFPVGYMHHFMLPAAQCRISFRPSRCASPAMTQQLGRSTEELSPIAVENVQSYRQNGALAMFWMAGMDWNGLIMKHGDLTLKKMYLTVTNLTVWTIAIRIIGFFQLQTGHSSVRPEGFLLKVMLFSGSPTAKLDSDWIL